MVYLPDYKCYQEVLKHRKTCKKWKNSIQCLECFGGGLTPFTTEFLREAYDKLQHGEYADE